MPFKLLVVIFLFPFIAAHSQVNDNEWLLVEGLVKDSANNPVSYAHIKMKHGNQGWVSDYYGTFRALVNPGDSLIISAIPFHPALLVIPVQVKGNEYIAEVILNKIVFELKEIVIRTYPATFEQLKEEFMEVEVEDPQANLDIQMPSMKEIMALAKTPGVPGQIGLYSGPGPFSMLYNQFSKEAKSKKLYAELMTREKAGKRFNKELISRITGLKSDDDIKKFIEFCALQIKFILESTDYELYAAILVCYNEYCANGYAPDPMD